jgi:hypothetical protein
MQLYGYIFLPASCLPNVPNMYPKSCVYAQSVLCLTLYRAIWTIPCLRIARNWMKAQRKESLCHQLDVSIELANVADIRRQASASTDVQIGIYTHQTMLKI